MPQKLETVLKKVEEISNDVNTQLIKDYHRYLLARDTGTNRGFEDINGYIWEIAYMDESSIPK